MRVFSTYFCCIGPMPVKNLSEVSVVKIASGFRGIILTCDTYVCVFSTLSSVKRNSIHPDSFVVRPGMDGRPCALKGPHVDERKLKYCLEGVGLQDYFFC